MAPGVLSHIARQMGMERPAPVEVDEGHSCNPKVPQELLDQVIDHLWNDVKSLAACALTCHAFLSSARTHLFHDQRLTGAKCCARFELFLEACPDVTPYIRRLSVTEPMSTAYAQNWVNRIPALVARLERLETLELVGLHYVSLQRCTPDVLAAFARLTKLVFADVYFDHFLDVHTILAAACNSKDLRFYRIGWGNNTPPAYNTPPDPSRLQLQKLVVDSWATSAILRAWLLPCAELGEVDIRTLMIRWRERDSTDLLNSLFAVCGPALQHLYVELPTTIEGERARSCRGFVQDMRADDAGQVHKRSRRCTITPTSARWRLTDLCFLGA